MTNEFPSPAEMYELFYGPGIFQPLTILFAEFAAPQPGERVLDLACGTGLVARHVAPLAGPHGKVVAVDINPAMLDVARKQPSPPGAVIDWREGDAVTIDLPEHEFDLILCQQGLQFFSDQSAALRRLRSLLAPGGRLALATWQEIERHTLFAEFAQVEVKHLAPLGVGYDDLVAPFSLGDPARVQALLEGAGFSQITMTTRSIEARFSSPETFARKMETAYGSVIPDFVKSPKAFAAYLDAVENETRELVQRYSQNSVLSFPMFTNLALAYAS